MVLPDRIELSTSPFITLTLSRPPHAAFVRWTIPSPWSDLCWTLGVARLVSTPSPKGLARDCRRHDPDGFPDFGRCSLDRFRPRGQFYQGSALPLSYGSKLRNDYDFRGRVFG